MNKKLLLVLLIFIFLFQIKITLLSKEENINFFSPLDIIKWQYLGLKGFEIRDIAIDPKNSKIIYVATYGDGVYKSTDGGKTWIEKNNGIDYKILTYIKIDPYNNNIIYTTGYKSYDYGESWNKMVPNILPYNSDVPWPYNLVVDPKNSNIIYYGTVDGLYKSIDGGKNFFKIGNGFEDLNYYSCILSIAIDPNNTNVIYISVDYAPKTEAAPKFYVFGVGVFKSIDNGNNFKKVLLFKDNGDMIWGIDKILIDYNNTHIIYVESLYHIYRSINSGETWEIIDDNLIYCITIDLKNNVLYGIGRLGEFFISYNHGENWSKQVNIDKFNHLEHSISAIKIDTKNQVIIYIGIPSGIYKLEFTETTFTSPQNLKAKVYSNKITLSWDSSTTETYPISGYAIYKGTLSGSETFYTSVSQTSFEDYNITSYNEYYYYVKAFDAQDNYSDPSYELPVITKKWIESILNSSSFNVFLYGDTSWTSDELEINFDSNTTNFPPKNYYGDINLFYKIDGTNYPIKSSIRTANPLNYKWNYPKFKNENNAFEFNNFHVICKINGYSMTETGPLIVSYVDDLMKYSHSYSLCSVSTPPNNPNLNPKGFKRDRDGYSFVNNLSFTEIYINSLIKKIKNLYLPLPDLQLFLSFVKAFNGRKGLCRGFSASSIVYREYSNLKPVNKNIYDMKKDEVIDQIVDYEINYLFEEASLQRTYEANYINNPNSTKSEEINKEFLETTKNLIEGNQQVLIDLWNLGKIKEEGAGHSVAAHQVLIDNDSNNSYIGIYDPNNLEDKDPYFKITSHYTLESAPFGFNTFIATHPSFIEHDLTVLEIKRVLNEFISLTKDFIDIIVPFSPINILITDEFGRKLGYVNGEIVNKIPGSSYQQINETDIVYFIPSGLKYKVETIGTKSGNFGIDIVTNVDNNDKIRFVSYQDIPTTTGAKSLVEIKPGSSYILQVDSNGDGIYDTQSSPVFNEEKVVPPSPVLLEANVSGNSVVLSWNSSTPGTYPISGYAIYKGTTSGSELSTPIATVDVNTISYNDTNVTSGTTYYYYVKAFDNQNPPNYSGQSNEVSAILITYLIPQAPSLSIQLVDDLPYLNWNPSKEGTYPIKGYEIYRGESFGKELLIDTVDSSITSYKDINVIPGTTYNYYVKAFDTEKKYSEPSNKVSITVPLKEYVEKIILKLQIGSKIIFINDISVEIDVSPIIIEGRTYLPIRWVAEPLGASVSWDNIEKKITILFKNIVIELWVGRNIARVNGNYKFIDPDNPNIVPIIIEGRTMLPIRFVAENLGCDVKWDALTKTITIIYPKVE